MFLNICTFNIYNFFKHNAVNLYMSIKCIPPNNACIYETYYAILLNSCSSFTAQNQKNLRQILEFLLGFSEEP